MKPKVAVIEKVNVLLKVLLAVVLAVIVCLLMYQYDNKYTTQRTYAQSEGFVVTEEALSENPIIFLVDGWEYYGNKLLSPENFESSPPIPDEIIFIGQFGGFERWSKIQSPHGSASYRLTLQLPEQPASYMLELPEIFSAYHLYINGDLVKEMGSPEPESYRPETGNSQVNITAGGTLEILLAVSDYSHLYSGLVYPPAFGSPEAVTKLLDTRLAFRSSVCGIALVIGLLSILICLLTRKHVSALLFGLLCLSFVGYFFYPITSTLFPGYDMRYLVENLSFCAMLCLIIVLTGQICNLKSKWWHLFVCFGCLVCVATVLLHLWLPVGNLTMLLFYSKLITLYEWLTALFITFSLLYSVIKGGRKTTPLLYGVVLFDIALIMDRLLPLFEPIRFGWFIELASFALVLAIGVSVGQNLAEGYRAGLVMSERAANMEQLYQSQFSYYSALKKEVETTKIMRHDVRHQLSVISNYLDFGQYDKLKGYLSEYKSTLSQGNIPEYCPIDVINILTYHYDIIAKEKGISLEIRYDLAERIDAINGITDSDLCRIYSNLLENAVEGCLRSNASNRFIHIAVVSPSVNCISIKVINTSEKTQQKEDQFLSFKRETGTGYGLRSIRSIVEQYGGTSDFSWDVEKKEFKSKVNLFV